MRGAMHTAIERESGPWTAALLTAPLFAVLHFFAKARIPAESSHWGSGFDLLSRSFAPLGTPSLVLDSFTGVARGESRLEPDPRVDRQHRGRHRPACGLGRGAAHAAGGHGAGGRAPHSLLGRKIRRPARLLGAAVERRDRACACGSRGARGCPTRGVIGADGGVSGPAGRGAPRDRRFPGRTACRRAESAISRPAGGPTQAASSRRMSMFAYTSPSCGSTVDNKLRQSRVALRYRDGRLDAQPVDLAQCRPSVWRRRSRMRNRRRPTQESPSRPSGVGENRRSRRPCPPRIGRHPPGPASRPSRISTTPKPLPSRMHRRTMS